MYLATVYVIPKPNVADPQGKAVTGALHSLGFAQAREVRVGKVVEVTLQADDAAAAEAAATEMCERLLANPVVESYRVEVRPLEDAPT